MHDPGRRIGVHVMTEQETVQAIRSLDQMIGQMSIMRSNFIASLPAIVSVGEPKDRIVDGKKMHYRTIYRYGIQVGLKSAATDDEVLDIIETWAAEKQLKIADIAGITAPVKVG